MAVLIKVPKDNDVIDVDQIDEMPFKTGLRETTSIKIDHTPLVEKHLPRMPSCGIVMLFPPGKNHHTSYWFGLHNEHPIPWN